MQYPFAITGAVVVLLSLGGIAAAYAAPFGITTIRGNGETAEIEYGIMEYSLDDGSEKQSMKYRDHRLDDGPGISALRLGFWLVPIGGFLLLGSSLALLAAPSTGRGAARGGAVAGLVASTVLLVGVVSLLVGFTDHAELFASSLGGAMEYGGSKIAAGTIWLGAAVVFGFGGSVMGFSDKAPTTTTPATRSCGGCAATVPAGQSFCGTCGAAV